MKNVVKMILVVAVSGLFSLSVSAQNQVEQDTIKKDTVKKEAPVVVCLASDEVTYAKIEVADVPEVVKSAVAAKYAAYVTDEAYKGSDNSYKLVLKKEKAKLVVYYSETGQFQKEEAVKETQSV